MYVHVYRCGCVFVCVCMCVCICMCLCVHRGQIHATEHTRMSKDTLCELTLVFASNHVISQSAHRSSDLAASASTSWAISSAQKVQFWELYLCVSFFLILRWMHIFLIVVLFSEKLILNISSYLPLLLLTSLIMNSCLWSSFVIINGPLFTENGHVVINQHPQFLLLFYT